MNNKPFWYHPKTGRFFDEKKDIPETCKDDLQYWDSILEFDTYQRILQVFPTESIKTQYVIELLPKVNPFPKWTWNVDFFIQYESRTILVESKGKWILYDELNRKAFVQTLRMLSQVNQSYFDSLILVDYDFWSIPNTQIPVHKLDTLPEILRQR